MYSVVRVPKRDVPLALGCYLQKYSRFEVVVDMLPVSVVVDTQAQLQLRDAPLDEHLQLLNFFGVEVLFSQETEEQLTRDA
jgi:hypothetical protein